MEHSLRLLGRQIVDFSTRMALAEKGGIAVGLLVNRL